MITTVMFDMGGTLEDIYVDEYSELAAIDKLDEMLRGWGRIEAARGCRLEEIRPFPRQL